MNFHRVWVVARKEIKDAFRDKRSIYSMLIGTLVAPLLFGYMFNRMAEKRRGAEDFKVPVVGAEYAPLLIDWLGQQPGIEIVPGPTDPEVAVRDRTLEVVLIIPKNHGAKFRESSPAPVKVVSDSTSTDSMPKVNRLKTLLRQFGAQVGGLRLIERGVSPSIASALVIEDVEVSNARQRAAMILGIVPLLVIMSAFTASISVSTDSTAGERERGSLEPLLVNPVPRMELVAGKWLAGVLAASAGLIFTLVLFSFLMMRLPLHQFGFRFRFGWGDTLVLFAGMWPVALLMPAMQMYVATFARSFKEAQGYIGPMILLCTAPGIVNTMYPLDGKPWLSPIPLVGQYALALEVVRGNLPPLWSFLIAELTVVLVSGCLLVLTKRLFERERIIFGR